MQEITNTNTVSANDDSEEYLELEFAPSTANTNYTVGAVTYDSFKTFAVKIVMSTLLSASLIASSNSLFWGAPTSGGKYCVSIINFINNFL